MTELIIWLARKLVALLAFGIPGYRELFCRGLSFFAIFVGHSPMNFESYLRGLTYKKFSQGKKILVGRHVIFHEGKGKVSIGENSIVNNFSYIVSNKKGGYVKIGRNSHIDAFSCLHGQGGLSIGDNCGIGSGFVVYTQSNQYSQEPKLIVEQDIVFQEVVISDGVWIGASVTILPGATIGANAVISANSLVTGDIPENAIAAGSPAKIVMYNKVGILDR